MASNGETSQASPSENGYINEQMSIEVTESTDLAQNLKRKKEALDEPPLKQSRIAEIRPQSPEHVDSATSNNTSVDDKVVEKAEDQNGVVITEGSESTREVNGTANGEIDVQPTTATTHQASVQPDGADGLMATTPAESHLPEVNDTITGDGKNEVQIAPSLPEVTATSSVEKIVDEGDFVQPSGAAQIPETNGTTEEVNTEVKIVPSLMETSPTASTSQAAAALFPVEALSLEQPSGAPEVPETNGLADEEVDTEVKVVPSLTETGPTASTSQANAALYPVEAISLEQPDDAPQMADPADSAIKAEVTETGSVPPKKKRKKQRKSAASKAREMKQRYRVLRRQQLQQSALEASHSPEDEELRLDTGAIDDQAGSSQNPSHVENGHASLQPDEVSHNNIDGSRSPGSLSDTVEPSAEPEATSSGVPVKRRKRQKKSVAAKAREMKLLNAKRNALKRQALLQERLAAAGEEDGQVDEVYGVLDYAVEDQAIEGQANQEEGVVQESAEPQPKPRVGRGKYTRGKGRKKSSAIKAYEARRKAQAKRLAKWQAQLEQQALADQEQEAAIEAEREGDHENVESEVQPGAPIVRQKRKYTRRNYGETPKRLSKRQIALQESKADKDHQVETEWLPPPQKRKYVRRAKPASDAMPSTSGFVLPQPGQPVSTPYMISPQRIISERRAIRREPSMDETMSSELEQDLENTATRGLPQMQPEPEEVPLPPQQQLEMPPNAPRADIPPNVPQYITVEAQPEAESSVVTPYHLPVIEVASDYTSLCQMQRPIMINPTYCYYVVPAGHHVVPVPPINVPQNIVAPNPTVDEAPQNEVRTSPTVPRKKNKKVAMVDLTLDSDDEEPTSSVSPNSTTTISSRDRGFTPSMSSRVNSATPSTSSRINGFVGQSSAEPTTPPKKTTAQKAQERPVKPVQKEMVGHLNGRIINSSKTASSATVRSAVPTVNNTVPPTLAKMAAVRTAPPTTANIAPPATVGTAPPTAAITAPPATASTAPPATAPVKPFKITMKPVRTAVQHLESNQNKAFKRAVVREQIRRYRTFTNYNLIHPFYLTHEWISTWVTTMLVVSALQALVNN